MLLANLGAEPVVIRRGDRIAQLIVAPVSRAAFESLTSCPQTDRGDGGFGSTGIRLRARGRERLHRRAGAVGTFLGRSSARVGVDVEYAPRAIDDVKPYDADVAIVATKSFDTDARSRRCAKPFRIREKCVFVTPQNGVGNEEKLAAAFGADRVVAAALTVPIDRDRDGTRRARTKGASRSPRWARALQLAGRDVRRDRTARQGRSTDWRSLKWSKLALNVVANAQLRDLERAPQPLWSISMRCSRWRSA